MCQIVDYINNQSFKSVTKIVRIDDNVIQLLFDLDFYLYIDLQKSKSSIYRKKQEDIGKNYQAAFDVVLKKIFSYAQFRSCEIVDNDKIMRLWIMSQGSYKREMFALDFEFTGKYTNAIIIDNKMVVIEALRHITSNYSSRIVQPGAVLAKIPKAKFAFKEYLLEDVNTYLFDVYSQIHKQSLNSIKSIRIKQLKKQLKKLQSKIKALKSSENLLKEAKECRKKGELVIANLDKIKPYEKILKLIDFENKKVEITLNKNYDKVNHIFEDFFNMSKKFKKKAKSIHIEQENLCNRINFVKRLIILVEDANNKNDIEFLFTKQKKKSKKIKVKPYEIFYIGDYKIVLGRNAKANQALLSDCKADDLWFHFKDRNSAHVCIIADKQKIPYQIIKKAARLCVDFTVDVPGRYSIDYTKRKEVQIQDGSSVLYNKYETIIINKRGKLGKNNSV